MPTQSPARLTRPVAIPPRALDVALAAYEEGGHHDEAVEYALAAATPLILAANTPPAPVHWVRRHARELAAAGSLGRRRGPRRGHRHRDVRRCRVNAPVFLEHSLSGTVAVPEGVWPVGAGEVREVDFHVDETRVRYGFPRIAVRESNGAWSTALKLHFVLPVGRDVPASVRTRIAARYAEWVASLPQEVMP